MKSLRLQYFFKSRKYRNKYLLYVKACIIAWFKKPIIYIKAIHDAFKLNIDFPNRWDKYVKIKEIEHATELEQKRYSKHIAYNHFLETIVKFDICLLTYCSFTNRNDITQENYDKLSSDFCQIKKEFQKYVKELDEMAVVVPEELKTIVESTNVDKFTNFDEYKIFSDNLHAISDTINVTY